MQSQIKRLPPVWLRWLVLFFISLAMLGNYYIYDSISPLADMLESQLGFTHSGVSLLMAIYSFPNLFMVLIGGIIIDRIGTKKSMLLFSGLVMIGAIITCSMGNLTVMAIGRLIFGLGAESMIIAITTSIARWFKGKELSFAFGLNLTVARLGTFLAQNSPSWASKLYEGGWQPPLILAATAGVFAVVCLVVYAIVDRYSERQYNLPKEGSQDEIKFKELFKFSPSFWYISLLCFVFYSAMFPFTSNMGIMFFQHVHGESLGSAGFLVSIPILMAIVFTPLFGLLADKIGKRSRLMMIGSLAIAPIYFILGYKFNMSSFLHLPDLVHVKIGFLSIDNQVSVNILIPMVLLGLAFSLVPSVMWPSVALIVEDGKLGTAYGLMTMIQSFGLVAFNLLIGFANDTFKASAENPDGYIPSMWIFSICGILGMIFAIYLKRTANKSLEEPMSK